MNVTTEPRDNRQLLLTIEVEPERVDAALAQAARRLAQKYKIPGFRPGKAPRDVVERMVGKQALLEEVVDDLGPKVYKEALDTHNIEPYGMGEMEDFTLEPMVFKMIVPLAPVIELGDYKSLRVPYIEPEVDEHDIEHQLDHIRDNNAIIEPAAEDAVAESNMIATVDIEGTVEGEPFITKQSSVQINLFTPLDRDEEMLDFSEPIIGMKAGEDKTFTLPVPSTERYGEFAGKPAEFQVHLISLQKRDLPALDDSLAQTVGDYETLDALKNEIRGELLDRGQTPDRRQVQRRMRRCAGEAGHGRVCAADDQGRNRRTGRTHRAPPQRSEDGHGPIPGSAGQDRRTVSRRAQAHGRSSLAARVGVGGIYQTGKYHDQRRRDRAANRSAGGLLWAAVERGAQGSVVRKARAIRSRSIW